MDVLGYNAGDKLLSGGGEPTANLSIPHREVSDKFAPSRHGPIGESLQCNFRDLFVPESLDWVQARGRHGRVHAEKNAHDDR